MALPIVLQPVGSQMVAKLGYLPDQQTLIVEFAGNHSVYAYFGVPRKHYEALLRTGSIGRYMNQHILRKFPAARLTTGEKTSKAKPQGPVQPSA